jgi:hypothetical protein
MPSVRKPSPSKVNMQTATIISATSVTYELSLCMDLLGSTHIYSYKPPGRSGSNSYFKLYYRIPCMPHPSLNWPSLPMSTPSSSDEIAKKAPESVSKSVGNTSLVDPSDALSFPEGGFTAWGTVLGA